MSLSPLMRQNFLEYASYVVVDRAIPDLRDVLGHFAVCFSHSAGSWNCENPGWSFGPGLCPAFQGLDGSFKKAFGYLSEA